MLRPTLRLPLRPSFRPFALTRVAGRALLLAACIGAPLAGALAIGGCRGERVAGDEPSVLLEPNTFKVTWSTRLDAGEYGDLREMFVRDDLLIAYSEYNVVTVLSAGGGQTRWIASDLVREADRLWPPVLLDALNRYGSDVTRILAFPSNTRYILTADDGRRLDVTDIDRGERALTSPSFGDAGLVYVGLADERTGRAAKIDPTRPVNPVLDPTHLSGVVIARPVVFGGTFFVADESGRVWAIAQDGFQAWPEQYFQTGGAINAALTADEYGLYVASVDSVLYVLDRQSGRMKWRYFAEDALFRPAFPTQDHVFLPVEGRVVALSKTEGGSVGREPAWEAEGAVDVLSHDDRNVYLLHDDGSVVAHAKTDGRELFRTERSDFTHFARNPDGATIYAATGNGELMAIDPVLTRGQVGRVAGGQAAPGERHPMASARN